MAKKSLPLMSDAAAGVAGRGLVRLSDRTRVRLSIVVLVSLAAHALLLAFLHFRAPPLEPTSVPISALLVPVKPPEPQVPAPEPPRRVVRRVAARPVVHEAQPTAEAPASVIASNQPAPVTEPSGAGTGSAPGLGASGATAGPSTAPPAAPPAAPPPARPGSPPRSATLEYDVLGLNPKRDAKQGYGGSATLSWKLDGKHYNLDFSGTILGFLSLFDDHSDGAIDDGGLVPQHFHETSRKHAPATLDLGTANPQRRLQDRVSALLQIGSMLHADPSLSQAGSEITLEGMDPSGSVETWRYKVVGSESVKTVAGDFNAVHVSKVLRAGSHDRAIDLWLDPAHGDYPVRILYTEPDGSYIDARLSQVR